METEAEKAQEAEKAEETQETGDDDKFVVLAVDDDGFALMQLTSSTRVLVYTARRAQSGRFYKGTVPIAAFVGLTREFLEKVDTGEIAVEVE